MFLLILAACPDTADVAIDPAPTCGEGFALADDGRCYQIEADADTDVDTDTGTPAVDADGDGDGVVDDEDCAPADAAVYPGAQEICDGLDQDCDGVADEDVVPTWYVDADSDGYGDAATSVTACDQPTGYAAADGDCNDADAAYNPGALEADCTDPADYNCDGATGYADDDDDGWAACTECDDTTAGVNPGATESCNEVDDNCDGAVDEGVTTTFYDDVDGDGYGNPMTPYAACEAPAGTVANDDDCNDEDVEFSPAAAEVCDGVDQDCDGAIDDGVTETLYTDRDGDGYGTGAAFETCPDTDNADNADDCNDRDADVHPDAADDDGDGVDDDCDGTIDG